MADNNGSGNTPESFGMPLVTGMGSPNIASEMIGQDDAIRKHFLTLTYFKDEQEAKDFVWCVNKCLKYDLKDQLRFWDMYGNSKTSIKGWRSTQIVDILTQIQRVASESGKGEANDPAKNRGIKTTNS